MIMEKNYKRQYRECPVEVRQKISAKMKGRKKSDMTKQRISMGMKNYWRDVPSMSGSDFTTTGRIVWLVFYEIFLYVITNNKRYNVLWMPNYQDYDVDFRELGLNENEQKVVLDFFHQLGEILFNNKIEKMLQDE